MAASVLSLGMFTVRAFCSTRRSDGFEAGSGPPPCTAMVMSLAMRVNCFAMRFQRANIACFLTSNMRPMSTPSDSSIQDAHGSNTTTNSQRGLALGGRPGTYFAKLHRRKSHEQRYGAQEGRQEEADADA